MAAASRGEDWKGGYIRTGNSGRQTYVIHRMVGGIQYEVSTKRSTEPEAYAQLAIFEKNPTAYVTARDAGLKADLMPDGPPPVYLDAELIKKYLAYCATGPRPCTKNWWNMKRRFLEKLLVKLNGVDLRGADLQVILKAIERETSRPHLIATIKHLYSWLRDAEGANLLTAGEDPTLAKLKVPQSSPQQWTTPKVFSVAQYKKLSKAFRGTWYRDALDVLAGTGWHYSELRRFAEDGEVDGLPRGERKGSAVAALVTKHKSGSRHATRVTKPVLAAAKRLRAKGHLPEFHFGLVLKNKSAEMGIEPAITPGRFRHAVATWAKRKGVPLASIATFLGHKSPRTTQRFYAVHGSAAKVWTPV
ncbi:MAG TPA: site-specific integrase [Myxococcales bacterium]